MNDESDLSFSWNALISEIRQTYVGKLTYTVTRITDGNVYCHCEFSVFYEKFIMIIEVIGFEILPLTEADYYRICAEIEATPVKIK